MILGINDKIKMSDLKVQIRELELENEELKSQVKGMQALIDQANNELTNATPHIDFDAMRVFSIERVANNNKPCTIIGYYMNEPIVSSDGEMVVDRDVVKEWNLYCNAERHEELVQKFIDWKKQNGN